jgi:PAS domain S-box-containing protein
MNESFSEPVAAVCLSRSQVQQALLRVQADSVRPVALGLGILYAAFTASHLVVLSPELGARMAVVAGLSAFFYFVVYWRLRTRVLPDEWVHPLSLTLYAVAILNSELHLYLSRDPLQSTNVALCIIGAGIFLLSRRWLTIAILVTLMSWFWIVSGVAPPAQIVHFVFLMLGAVVVAALAFLLRRRNLMRVETLRLEAQARAAELERAVEVARRTEQSLHETETRYRNLVEQLPAATFIDALDANATTLYISPQIYALTGYSPEEWIADPQLWEKILHPDDRARVMEMTRLHNESGVPFDLEYRMLARDGSTMWVHDKAVVIHDAQGKPLYSQGYLADITPRKLAEESVRRREAILEAVSFAAAAFLRAPQWEQHIDAVLARLGRAAETDRVYVFENYTDAQGTILTSERFEWSIAGIAPHLGDPAWQNVPIAKFGFQRWLDLLGAGKPVYGQVRDLPEAERVVLTRQNIHSIALMPIFVGAEWWGSIGFESCLREHVWSQAELDALETAASIFGAAIQRERSERALADARDEALEASRLKSEFLAMMSHEIRTPMNSIVGMSELLLETNLNVEQRDYAKLVRHSADALLQVLNDILDFSKIEAGKLSLELMDFHLPSLALLTQEIVRPQARAKGLVLRTALSADLPEHFVGDAGRIRQALLNLLSNAVKFTLRGEIVLSIHAANAAASATYGPGDIVRVVFEVRDTGIGLTEQARGRLFQPFTQADMSITRRFGGTGLGLVISKRLVELMGGEIGVESAPGVGSTFWFTLPLRVGEPEGWTLQALAGGFFDAVDEAMTPLPFAVNGRVLLVEDNEMNRKLAQLQLSKLGIRNVTVVENGAAAVTAVRNAAAESAPFDLVLMDCQMPEMDGFAATRAIREWEQTTGLRMPIVALTANAMRGDREACLAAGMDDYLGKPLRLNMLRRVIERWLFLTESRPDIPQSAHAPPLSASFVTLDPTALAKLRALETPETTGMVNNLVEAFMEETGAQLKLMDEGFLETDFEQVCRAAHSVKAGAASLGAYGLAARAAEIEAQAKTRTAGSLEELLPDCRDEFERVKAMLKLELRRAPE